MTAFLFIGGWIFATLIAGPFGLIGWPIIWWLGEQRKTTPPPT